MLPFLDLQAVNRQYADEIREALYRVSDSGWYLRGRETEQFEKHYAAYIGTRHCVGVGNGLDALTLIYRAYIEMGLLHEGDEVIVPANTYIASILAVTDNRLTPVFVEPDPDTLQIDGTLIEQAITPRTRSVMIVHLYGRCAYTAQIGDLCRRHHLLLVEDNAQAHGCRFGHRHTGSIGHAAGHSFYPGKNLGAMGDAGAVTTDDDTLAAMVRALGNYGSERKYVFHYAGRNSRMDELQAAVLDVKLRHLDADNARRQEIAHYYYTHLSDGRVRMPRRVDDSENVYHTFPVFSQHRDRLQQHLASQGIQTLIHYPIPPHRQQCYAQYAGLSLPVTEQIHREELSLPISPVHTLAQARAVVSAIKGFHVER